MTTQTRYICDICRNGLECREEYKGVYFVSGGIELRAPAECNRHVCKTCWGWLVDYITRSRQCSNA